MHLLPILYWKLIAFLPSTSKCCDTFAAAYTTTINSTMSSDTFEIPITWKDAEISFSARFIPAGYITRIGVDVYGQEHVLEPDEEGQYRLLMDADESGNYPEIDLPLLKEIAEVLNNINGAN